MENDWIRDQEGRVIGQETDETWDIRAFLFKAVHHFYWFAAALAIAFTVAYLYNHYTEPVYKVTGYLLIKDKENPMDPQNFIGASLYGNPYMLQNEIGTLKSKSLTQTALRQLDFGVSYFLNKPFSKVELYHNTPFQVVLDSAFDQPLQVPFNVTFLNDTLMRINAAAKEVTCYNFRTGQPSAMLPDWMFDDTVSFGQLTGNQYCRFRLFPVMGMMAQIKDHRQYSFVISSPEQLVNQYRLKDVEDEKNSSILQISLECQNPEKGAAFLNKLANAFLARGIERDDKIASSTIAFINRELKGVTDSLRFSEDKLQQFRSSEGVTNIDFQAQQTYQKMEDLQDQKAQLIVKSKYYNYLKDYLVKNNKVDDLIAPSSMDINDPLLNNLILDLTNLYAERTEMSFNSVKNNPYINSLESVIADTKAKLMENIDNIIKAGDISLQSIDQRIRNMQEEISKLPGNQRELLTIERTFKLNDDIYTYLLTKRSEVQISKASNLPSNEVLDRASADDAVLIRPKARMSWVIALLTGLFIPGILLYLQDYFRNSISGREDIQMITDIPIIGHILHNGNKEGRVVQEYPGSVVSESFRSLRTNFQFFSNETGKNTVLITSLIKGEGKSFMAVNLGTVFAHNKKKVVVIDFDLRKARIHEYMGIDSQEGVSRYLSNNIPLHEVIFPSGIENLDVIPSGPVPPNPTELISSPRTEELFAKLSRQYDLIVVDSPPVGLVSDALLLLRYANIRLLVVRQNFTPRALFATMINDLQKRNIDRLNIVLNDQKPGQSYGYGYAYSYDYGYSDVRKKLPQKIREMFQRIRK